MKNLFSFLNKNLIFMLCGILLSFNAISNSRIENDENNMIEYILQEKEADFDAANSKEQKIQVIANKFNFVFEQNAHNMNALALAIGNGDIRLVKKFLDIVDDINDENLWVSISNSGITEIYTLADVAIDAESFIGDDTFNTSNHYAIIQLLINKNIQFAITPKNAYNELQYIDDIYTTQKQKVTEIAALFDEQHPQNNASLVEYNRFKTPRTKSFHIMHIYGELYGYDNLNPDIYAAFQEGQTKLKNEIHLTMESN